MVFCIKGAPRIFTKFKGKHLCQSLFFNKVTGLNPVNFAKLLRTPLVTAFESSENMISTMRTRRF